MKISEKKKDKDTNSVRIEGDFNIYNVGEIKSNIEKYLKDSSNLELDLSGVKKIDTAGFQLLVFIKHEKNIMKKNLKIVKPSKEVKSFFENYKYEIF